MRRLLGVAGLLGLLALGNVTIVGFLPPVAARLDPLIVAVLVLGFVEGPTTGGLAGLWAGLLLDLLPPAAGPIGGWSLVLGAGGMLIGHARLRVRAGPLAALGMLAGAAGGVVLARGAVLWFSGSAPDWSLLMAAGGTVISSMLLAPLGLLLVARPRRRETAPFNDARFAARA